jgi:DNA-binding transcriptional MerR regulator
VSPDRLRAWERRYGLLDPERTGGGHRLYGQEDLVAVRAVLALVAAGWSVQAAAQQVATERRNENELSGAATLQPRTVSSVDAGTIRYHGTNTVTGSQQALAEALIDETDAPVAAAAVDVDTLLAVHEATRGLLRAVSPEDVTTVLVHLVERLEGAVGPASLDDGSVIPVDLSFGEGEPLLPYAPAFSVARLRLEAILPQLVEDARMTVGRLRHGPA